MNSGTKIIVTILGLLVFAILIILVVKAYLLQPQSTSVQQTDSKPLATKQLNKVYEFPILDSNGKEVSKLRYEVQSAELRNQVFWKAQPLVALSGKEFLIVNLKITNNSSSNISMQTHDYVRLSVDNKKEWLAADLHFDPVDIAAISTKYTRLGFTIDKASEKNLILQVGEIKGTKDDIPLKF